MLCPTALMLLFWQRSRSQGRKNSVAFQVRDVERMFGQRHLWILILLESDQNAAPNSSEAFILAEISCEQPRTNS